MCIGGAYGFAAVHEGHCQVKMDYVHTLPSIPFWNPTKNHWKVITQMHKNLTNKERGDSKNIRNLKDRSPFSYVRRPAELKLVVRDALEEPGLSL